MANTPSLTALLGLVAIAGYENRDKISSFIQGLTGGNAAAAAPTGGLSTTQVSGGLADLVNQMTQNGHGAAAASWTGTGANMPINASQLEQALGPDVINQISAKTGLPADQLLQQLAAVLPQVVDHLTPAGQMSGH